MSLKGGNINSFKKRIQKAHQQVPKIAAVEAEKFFMNSFAKEAWEGKKWQKRANDELGVKRTERRALLVETARLIRGFQRGHASGKLAVIIINATPYAAVHNDGLRVRGIQNVRAHHRRIRKGRAQVKSHTRKIDFKMPQRKFMGNSEELNRILRIKIVKNYRRAIQ